MKLLANAFWFVYSTSSPKEKVDSPKDQYVTKGNSNVAIKPRILRLKFH